MTIAWGSLLVVAVGSVAVAVTVVSLVAFALDALSRCREEAAGGGTFDGRAGARLRLPRRGAGGRRLRAVRPRRVTTATAGGSLIRSG
ncbi:hypothetical protein [Pseudonocardia xinjiangensis]|uniref:hypothetical protein n=1 Tax=Pseudonocardia xinjiangensis TaxID=75289 RepID=UPI001FE4DD95|nr:hypothetical protein [Pseudonocardia xinjiangensis]